jgi:hypothetical protein
METNSTQYLVFSELAPNGTIAKQNQLREHRRSGIATVVLLDSLTATELEALQQVLNEASPVQNQNKK